MKKPNQIAFLCLLSSITGGAAFASKSVAVPASGLLEAARKIIAQTGPYYRATGNITCFSVTDEFPPYVTKGKCEINVAGTKATLSNANDIVAAVQKAQPAYGPSYSFQGTFEAVSLSSDMVQSALKETATLTLP